MQSITFFVVTFFHQDRVKQEKQSEERFLSASAPTLGDSNQLFKSATKKRKGNERPPCPIKLPTHCW